MARVGRRGKMAKGTLEINGTEGGRRKRMAWVSVREKWFGVGRR